MSDSADPKAKQDLEEAQDAMDEAIEGEDLTDEQLDDVAGGWKIKLPTLKPVVDILNDVKQDG